MNPFKQLLNQPLKRQSESNILTDGAVVDRQQTVRQHTVDKKANVIDLGDIKTAALVDTVFTKLDKLPPRLSPIQSVDMTRELIVIPRRTGHHSVMDNREVDLYLAPKDGFFRVMVVKREARLVHKRDYNPYFTLIFQPGIYRVDIEKDKVSTQLHSV